MPSNEIVAALPKGNIFTRRACCAIETMVREAGIEFGRDMIVHDPRMWADWAGRGMLAIGESYMQGKWDSPHIDKVMSKLSLMPSQKKREIFSSFRTKSALAINVLLNPHRRSRDFQVAHAHYDLGNDFFASWLDPNMQYSCAYWKDADTLEDAQIAKMRLIGEKLQLEPGMRVLDIGCGWGGLGRFLAREYGVQVSGVTISAEQAKLCRELAAQEGLSEQIEILEQSYRDVTGQWDRIVSVGMFEHVGPRNYGEFFEVCKRCLSDDGLLLLHTIGSNASQEILNDRWITTYIFPNGTLPSIAQVARAVEKSFIIEDMQNIGPDYDRTLMSWHKRYTAAKPKLELNPVFERMWDFFLLYSASGFRTRKTQLWQFVMSRKRFERFDAARG